MQILELLLHCCTYKASVNLAGVWREKGEQTDTPPEAAGGRGGGNIKNNQQNHRSTKVKRQILSQGILLFSQEILTAASWLH